MKNILGLFRGGRHHELYELRWYDLSSTPTTIASSQSKDCVMAVVRLFNQPFFDFTVLP